VSGSCSANGDVTNTFNVIVNKLRQANDEGWLDPDCWNKLEMMPESHRRTWGKFNHGWEVVEAANAGYMSRKNFDKKEE